MGRRGFVGGAAAVLLVGASLGAPVAAAETTTTITVGAVEVLGGMLGVSGSLQLGDDAMAPVTVSTDGSGDATPSGAGLDIGNTTFQVVYGTSNPRLIVKTQIHDGPAAGNAPATGYSWPIAVDYDDSQRFWLGAGNPGTNFLPNANRWTALCKVTSGWSCGTPLSGSVTTTGITWELPFQTIAPAIQPGSVISQGGVYGGTPRSFGWPSVLVLAGIAPSDTAGFADDYLVPGGIDLAVVPAGTQESEVKFETKGQFNTRTGDFGGAIVAPTQPGDYTVWARTCWGMPDAASCVVATHDITL